MLIRVNWSFEKRKIEKSNRYGLFLYLYIACERKTHKPHLLTSEFGNYESEEADETIKIRQEETDRKEKQVHPDYLSGLESAYQCAVFPIVR